MNIQVAIQRFIQKLSFLFLAFVLSAGLKECFRTGSKPNSKSNSNPDVQLQSLKEEEVNNKQPATTTAETETMTENPDCNSSEDPEDSEAEADGRGKKIDKDKLKGKIPKTEITSDSGGGDLTTCRNCNKKRELLSSGSQIVRGKPGTQSVHRNQKFFLESSGSHPEQNNLPVNNSKQDPPSITPINPPKSQSNEPGSNDSNGGGDSGSQSLPGDNNNDQDNCKESSSRTQTSPRYTGSLTHYKAKDCENLVANMRVIIDKLKIDNVEIKKLMGEATTSVNMATCSRKSKAKADKDAQKYNVVMIIADVMTKLANEVLNFPSNVQIPILQARDAANEVKKFTNKLNKKSVTAMDDKIKKVQEAMQKL